MWGGPLRVLTLARITRGGFVCFCDVVVRDPFFSIIARTPCPDFPIGCAAITGSRPSRSAGSRRLVLCGIFARRRTDPAAIDRITGPGMGEV